MKIFKKEILLLSVIILLAAGVRFYNFPDRVTFWSEQARSLITSVNYIKEKPSLLGQEYFRQDSNAHVIYSGAVFNYSLVPLILIFNYNPVPITGYFAVLNIFTGIVVFLTVRKMFDEKIAVVATVLFLFNDYMIYHSLFIWNYNYLPLVGILILYLSQRFLLGRKKLDIFWIGLLCGIGISFQVLFLPVALLIFLVNIWKDKEKILHTLVFEAGLVIGNLPMVVFDIRHNFYQTETLIQYLSDTLRGKSEAGFAYYYLLPFWPAFAVVAAWVVVTITRRRKSLLALLILIYVLANLFSSKISWNKPTGMPEGLTVKDIIFASGKISGDSKGDFNVAEVLDFDKRAYVLRYFVEDAYGKKPLDELSYEKLKLLYVLAQEDYDFKKSGVWEITAGGPYKISLLFTTGRGYAIYKLEK